MPVKKKATAKKAAAKSTAGGKKKATKKVTRYAWDEFKKPRTPEMGHTPASSQR